MLAKLLLRQMREYLYKTKCTLIDILSLINNIICFSVCLEMHINNKMHKNEFK